ncbi:MAG: S46 family peptidase, partial [Prochloraceae cyanobacterium]|nr:S46 family peptidase [Prochloraceae cyanobacterium]
GMWQPQQLSELKDKLKTSGLELDPDALTKLTEHPMGAVVSLGGCTASFVSPSGLVLTNHHCARGSIQYNSKPSNNLLEKGFLAPKIDEELPAAPGSRVYITVAVDRVTDQIENALDTNITGLARYQAISDRQKQLVRECERDLGHSCRVYSFYGGLEYYLIKQLEIRDVRLVYAPASGIGFFGGDIDNWQWPRHTGDFAFYRAYVGKNGLPADYSPDNVPYQPKHYLKVSSTGLKPDDFVMVVGYPGRTNRYRLAEEVENTFQWYYPTVLKILANWSERIEKETENDPDAKIKYAGLVFGINNTAKNFQGMIDGFARTNLLQSKSQLERDLEKWIESDERLRDRYQDNLKNLKALIARKQAIQKRNLRLRYLSQSDLLNTASRLYRLSVEKQKPDKDREPGYQERDLTRFKESLIRLDRRFDSEVDKVIWLKFIEDYAIVPSQDPIEVFDRFFSIGKTLEPDKLKTKLDAMYQKTDLSDRQTRLKWMDESPKAFESSEDPFIQLAVAMFDLNMAVEREQREIEGSLQQLRSRYMEGLIAYYRHLGKPIYPDANGTLRVTFGRIEGYSAANGNFYSPFTILRGIAEKYTGRDPFNAPRRQLELIENKTYGPYYDPRLNSVPVNFLSDLDITGGNSGSPTLNNRGELVGLVFDGNYDSIISDWQFTDNSRAIHVDISYVLWVMEYVDNADNLLAELKLDRVAPR